MNDKHSYLVVFWSPFPTSDIEPYTRYFASALRRFGDIQCLNCTDRHDRRTRRLLHQADLVVITLHQSHRELCRLICECDLRFPNTVLLLTDYVEGGEPNLAQIAVEFRIPPSRLADIPYSPHGREGKKEPDPGRFSPSMRRELARAGHIMLQALGF